ncbi:GMC family oxidoreductase [Kribbella sancticallisti]|uniref:GMC family oxidoreductase n=1 Tax=Kribbella sancticallisti TaxID=460087 RepID=A0ABN2EPC7_9ACTN
MAETIDVVIVGAGPAGAVAAKEFTDHGYRVVCLEQGDWPDYAKARSGHADFELGARKHWNWDPNVRRGFGDYPVDDRESDITALMYAGVGGASVIYAAHWERFVPADFRTRMMDGVGDDWPYSYWDLEPYYTEIEQQFGISGFGGDTSFPAAEDPPLPPVPLNKVGRRGAEAMHELGWHWWPGTNAIATRDYGPLHVCGQRTACPFGCPTGAKGSVDRTHWRGLVAAGLELRAGVTVEQVLTDRGRACGVVYVDESGSHHQLRANVVILAANALGTPRILLNSADGSGIANSTDLVGRRLMMHPFGNAIGLFDEDMESWRGPFGQYLHSLQFYETDLSRGFVRGAKWELMPAGGPLTAMLPGVWGDEPVWGPRFTSVLRERFGRAAFWGVICEDLPDPGNRVTISADTDARGVPGVSISYRISANSEAMMEWNLARIGEVLEVMGARETIFNSHLRGTGWHLLGTTVMGDDPAGSVVDQWGRCHDVENLFVIDGSTFPTASGVNPTATIAAAALRSIRHLIAQRADVRVSA